jgi:hypothetical protein
MRLRGAPRRDRFLTVLGKEAPDGPVQLRWKVSSEDLSSMKVDCRPMLAANRDMRSLMLLQEVEPEGVAGDLCPPR